MSCPVKYPAFRPPGQEIQAGDVVRRHGNPWPTGRGIGIVSEVTDPDHVMVFWGRGIYRTSKRILEVLGEIN